MPDSASLRARRFHDRVARLVLGAVRDIRRRYRRDGAPGAARGVAAWQLAAATLASRAMAAEANREPYARPLGLVGRTALGFPVSTPLATIDRTIVQQVEAAHGALVDEMLAQLDLFVAAEVADAARAAASVEIALESDWTNYVRVLSPPSCDRCAILAGRVYRDLDGFLRHPLCDCQHWPVTSWEQAHDEGLLFSAEDAFQRGEVTGLSKADAQAIRDGADITAVVNAKRGMRTASIFGRDGVKITSASTTKRSAWRKANPDRPYRLRPESIYDLARDRDDLIRLLRLYGYIT